MIAFNASHEQLKKLIKNAIEASELKTGNFEDLELIVQAFHHPINDGQSPYGMPIGNGLSHMIGFDIIDLTVSGLHMEIFRECPSTLNPDIQTFAKVYPTWQALLESAGITDWTEI